MSITFTPSDEPKPIKPVEKQIELPRYLKLVEADGQAYETLQALEAEKQYDYFYQGDDNQDYFHYAPDGTATRYWALLYNGITWMIHVGKNKLPHSIYHYLEERENDKRQFAYSDRQNLGLVRRTS